MKNKTDKRISEHFKKLGKKSWEARKAKILATLDKKEEVNVK